MLTKLRNVAAEMSATSQLKHLLALALPISLGAMVQTSYHLINAFWVGRIDSDAVAIVAICFPINLLILALGSGLSLGGSILIAQKHGANDRPKINHFSEQTLSTLTLLSLAISVIGYALSPLLVELLGAQQQIKAETILYLRISFAGTLFAFLSMTYQAVLRSLGEAKAPLLIIIPGMVVSALLNPLLIFGWGPMPALGVEGAAYATVLSQVFTAVAGIFLMLRPRYKLTIKLQNLRPHWPTVGTLYRLGLPSAIEQSMGALTVSVMTVLAAKFGTIALAAYGIVFRIMTFTTIPVFGLSMAATILLGQTIGAGNTGKLNRIASEAAILGFLLMGTIAVCLYLAAEPIAHFFVPSDPALVEHCTKVLRIFVLSFPLMGVQMALTGAFRGAGDTLAAMVMTIVSAWLIQVPLCIVLSRYTTLQDLGLWWGIVIATFFSVTIVIGYFRSQRWKHKVLPAI